MGTSGTVHVLDSDGDVILGFHVNMDGDPDTFGREVARSAHHAAEDANGDIEILGSKLALSLLDEYSATGIYAVGAGADWAEYLYVITMGDGGNTVVEVAASDFVGTPWELLKEIEAGDVS